MRSFIETEDTSTSDVEDELEELIMMSSDEEEDIIDAEMLAGL